MAVNTFLDFQLNSTGTSIDHVFFCDSSRKIEFSLQEIFGGNSLSNDYNFKFTFHNLCQHYPNRILIYNEPNSVYCERQWWSCSNYALMSAYSRLWSMYLVENPTYSNFPINYTSPYYVDRMSVMETDNGLQMILISLTDIYRTPTDGSHISSLGECLLLYPLIFRPMDMIIKTPSGIEKTKMWYSYNPLLGLTENDLTSMVIPETSETYSEFWKDHKVTEIQNKSYTPDGNPLRFSMYHYETVGQRLPNIDLEKLNIGRGLYHV